MAQVGLEPTASLRPPLRGGARNSSHQPKARWHAKKPDVTFTCYTGLIMIPQYIDRVSQMQTQGGGIRPLVGETTFTCLLSDSEVLHLVTPSSSAPLFLFATTLGRVSLWSSHADRLLKGSQKTLRSWRLDIDAPEPHSFPGIFKTLHTGV